MRFFGFSDLQYGGLPHPPLPDSSIPIMVLLHRWHIHLKICKEQEAGLHQNGFYERFREAIFWQLLMTPIWAAAVNKSRLRTWNKIWKRRTVAPYTWKIQNQNSGQLKCQIDTVTCSWKIPIGTAKPVKPTSSRSIYRAGSECTRCCSLLSSACRTPVAASISSM